MDGRYCGRVASESRLTEVSFKLEAGGAVRRERVFTRADSGMFLPLDVRRIARPGVMKECSVSLKSGVQQVKKVPMVVADGAGNADVGMAKEMQGLRGLEENENTSRTSLDGMKESLHLLDLLEGQRPALQPIVPGQGGSSSGPASVLVHHRAMMAQA